MSTETFHFRHPHTRILREAWCNQQIPIRICFLDSFFLSGQESAHLLLFSRHVWRRERKSHAARNKDDTDLAGSKMFTGATSYNINHARKVRNSKRAETLITAMGYFAIWTSGALLHVTQHHQPHQTLQKSSWDILRSGQLVRYCMLITWSSGLSQQFRDAYVESIGANRA